jgi:hypothetical protein
VLAEETSTDGVKCSRLDPVNAEQRESMPHLVGCLVRESQSPHARGIETVRADHMCNTTGKNLEPSETVEGLKRCQAYLGLPASWTR